MSALDEDQSLMRRWLASGSLDDKKAFLDHRCNSFFYPTPSGTLEVSRLSSVGSTRWHPWLDVRDDPWWVDHANQFSIPHSTLLVDLDPELAEKPEAFEERIRQTKRKILDDGGRLLSDCFTGSRGRHLEFFVVEWAGLPAWKVRELRLVLLEHFRADLAKATLRTMILIPGCRNPKTGRPKTEVEA